MKAKVISACLLLAVGLFAILYFQSSANKESLPTYFEYSSEETAALKDISSPRTLSRERLYYWHDKAFNLVRKNKTGSSKAARIYTYLLTAQQDAAYLSFNSKGHFSVEIDKLSKEVLCGFYPKDCDGLVIGKDSDPFTEKVAEIVLKKIRQRISEDKKQTHKYERPEGDAYWIAKGVASGSSSGSWKAWVVPLPDLLRAPEPPQIGSAADLEQIELTRRAYSGLTDEKKSAIAFWAGGAGTKKPAGIWIKIARNYINDTDVSLKKELLILSVLAMSITDSYIIANDSKYTYWSQRPHMRDETIKTYMPTPNHPSYPSSAAATAGASVALLTHYFPENQTEWDRLGIECRDSRVWSGIHFPIDVNEGYRIGSRVWNAFLKSQTTKDETAQ